MSIETEQKLQASLSLVEEATARDEISTAFHLLDPVEFARLLGARGLSIAAKSKLLALKVEMPVYDRVDLQPLLERALQQMRENLQESHEHEQSN